MSLTWNDARLNDASFQLLFQEKIFSEIIPWTSEI